MRRTCFILFLFFSLSTATKAIYFKHIGVSDGLAQSSVMSIYQDELGRMWFGTHEGLSIYDGNTLVTFRHTEDSLLSLQIPVGNSNYPIVGDRNGNIYFRSDAKLIHYDVKAERFSCLKNENVSTVYCRDSLVLVAASDSIFRWDQKNKTLHLLAKTRIPGSPIEAFFIDSKNRVWIGGRRGLFLHDSDNFLYQTPDNKSLLTFEKGLQQIIKDVFVNEIMEDSQSNLWIATREDGMYRYSPDGVLKMFKHDPTNPNSLSSNQVRSFAEDNQGNIRIGVFAGLCTYNPETETYTNYRRTDLPGTLHHSSVYSVFQDKQSTIWVGTYYGGVHYFNPETDFITFYPAAMRRRNDCLSHFFVGRMTEDKNRNIWICTEGGGLNFFDRETKTFRHYMAEANAGSIAHNNLKSIVYSEKYDRLYIGTHSGGVSVFDINKGVFHNLRNEKSDAHRLIGDVIINTRLLNEDTLIIHSRNGLFSMDLVTGQLESLLDDNNRINGMLIFYTDSKQNLWIATVDAIIRINMNNKAQTIFKNTETGFGSLSATCIFEDRKGRLFFGTIGSGLYQLVEETGKFISFTAENNMLLSNYCYDIAQSEQGELVILSDKGISLLNPDEKKLRVINKDVLLLSSINYGNGLLTCRNGEIFAGGNGGLISFFEKEIFQTEKAYNLYFSSLTVNEVKVAPLDKTKILQQALPYTNKIILNHKQDNLNITFASNNYISAHAKDRYEYFLEGFDDKWITSDNIIYTNLPPGKYKLVVREKTVDPLIAAKTITMDIVIRHAWYANPIAYIMYALIVYFFFSYLVRIRKARFHLKTSLETERKEKEQIEQLNQAKLQFFSNISHEFNTPLSLIVVQIERLMNSSSLSPFVYNKLQKINKHALYIRNLICELLDFRKLEHKHITLKVKEINIIPFLKEIYYSFYELSVERNIKYTFEANETDFIPCWVDTKQLQKVFYNLLSNAFKFTKPNDFIELSVKEDADTVIIHVIDSGTGIDEKNIDMIFNRFYQTDTSVHDPYKAPSFGVGLSLSQGIVALHHGTVSVESKRSYGSLFTVRLKKGNNHFSADERSDRTTSTIGETDINCEARNRHYETLSNLITDNVIPENQKDETLTIESDNPKSIVLLIEDNEELLQILEEITRPLYRVFSARNGKEGLYIARKEKPDLIISDILMPGISGAELCVTVKNDFETCHIPVILLTALSSVEHQIYGLQHGADDYITKPFDEKMLLTRCNNLIRNRLLIKNKFNRNTDFDIQTISNNPIDQKFLDTLNRIVENNFDNPDFSMIALAGELNLSRSSLYAKFEALTGMKPNEYVMLRKLKKASDFLKNNPSMNISEISDLLGFGSPRYFSRCFKNRFGVSPVDFRRMYRHSS